MKHLADDSLRRAGRDLALHRGLDPAAVVMVGALAAARSRGRFVASATAEERAELLALAGHANEFQHFLDAATARAHQFLSPAVWRLVWERAARFSAPQAAVG